jgi:hypothetical protein
LKLTFHSKPVRAIFLAVGLLGILASAAAALRPRPHAPAPAPAAGKTFGISFEEEADRAGLRFRWNAIPKRPMKTIDAFGCGCAFLDWDNDGYQDVLLVGEPTCALFRNNGSGRFEDITADTGLDRIRGAWKACAVGDYDGDGYQDILLSGYHCLALLRSEGGRRLANVTEAAGLRADNWNNWGASAGFMDLDGDNDLDLVTLNYVVWGPHSLQYCDFNGIKSGCPPKVYPPERGRMFRNNGNGTFTDVSRQAGMDKTHGVGLVIGFADGDDDGKIDVYLGNDAAPADYLHNLGGLRFENVSLVNGTMYGNRESPLAAMGADWGDYDRDGRLDLAVPAFSHDSYALFHNEGRGMFVNRSSAAGIAGVTYDPLGFGTKFADVDNDGWPDLVFTNGHVYDRVAESNPGLVFRQPTMLFHNEGGHFTDIAPLLGPEFVRPILGRGSATADFDNDGRVDLLEVDYEGGPVLRHNTSQTTHHWVTLDLRGTGKNLLALGARVKLLGAGQQWVGQVSPTSSYLSSSDPRIHFGLGAVTDLQKLQVTWPDGRKEEFPAPRADAIAQIREGAGRPATGGL